MAQRRIHLNAPGGGAACGAHSLGKPNGEREVLASTIIALIDCHKCKQTVQYKDLVSPQYKLRLFRQVSNRPGMAEPEQFMVLFQRG